MAGDIQDPPHPLRVIHAPGAKPGHDRAHAGAADHVDGHPGFLQRPDHAQVGEPARAAAAEDQPAGGAGDHPGQPPDVARPAGAQVVMVGHRPALQPPGRPRRPDRVQQDEFAAQRAGGQRPGFYRADRGIIPGRGRQQDQVRLAQAEPAPRRVLRVGPVNHVVVVAFHRVQPPGQFGPAGVARCPLGRARAQLPRDGVRVQLDDRPRPRQLRHEPLGDHGRRPCALARGGHGNGAGRRRRHFRPLKGEQPVHGQQPVDQQPCHLDQQRRDPLDQGPERGHPQQQQVAVPDRSHGRRPGLATEQGDLSHDRIAAQVVQDALAAARRHADPEPAAHHQVQAVSGVALPEDHLSGGHRHGLKLPGQLTAGRLVKRGEQRDAGQERVQVWHILLAVHVLSCSRSKLTRRAARPASGWRPAPRPPGCAP